MGIPNRVLTNKEVNNACSEFDFAKQINFLELFHQDIKKPVTDALLSPVTRILNILMLVVAINALFVLFTDFVWLGSRTTSVALPFLIVGGVKLSLPFTVRGYVRGIVKHLYFLKGGEVSQIK